MKKEPLGRESPVIPVLIFQTDNVGTLAWQSLANVSILLCVIAVLTVVLVLAYKYRCYCLINGWLILSSFLLLFLFSFLYVTEVLKVKKS